MAFSGTLKGTSSKHDYITTKKEYQTPPYLWQKRSCTAMLQNNIILSTHRTPLHIFFTGKAGLSEDKPSQGYSVREPACLLYALLINAELKRRRRCGNQRANRSGIRRLLQSRRMLGVVSAEIRRFHGQATTCSAPQHLFNTACIHLCLEAALRGEESWYTPAEHLS